MLIITKDFYFTISIKFYTAKSVLFNRFSFYQFCYILKKSFSEYVKEAK